MPKRPTPPKPKAPDNRPVNQRGQEWQAEKLTGARAQKGNLLGGGPRWTYEVKWKGSDPVTKKPYPTTYEPAANLIGWGKEMKEVDKACELRALQAPINPFVEAQRGEVGRARGRGGMPEGHVRAVSHRHTRARKVGARKREYARA